MREKGKGKERKEKGKGKERKEKEEGFFIGSAVFQGDIVH